MPQHEDGQVVEADGKSILVVNAVVGSRQPDEYHLGLPGPLLGMFYTSITLDVVRAPSGKKYPGRATWYRSDNCIARELARADI